MLIFLSKLWLTSKSDTNWETEFSFNTKKKLYLVFSAEICVVEFGKQEVVRHIFRKTMCYTLDKYRCLEFCLPWHTESVMGSHRLMMWAAGMWGGQGLRNRPKCSSNSLFHANSGHQKSCHKLKGHFTCRQASQCSF